MKRFIFLSFLLTAFCLDFKYHTNKEIELYLHNYIERFPKISHLYSIGKSTEGVELWVMQLTASKPDCLIPHVKLISNIHGNEAVGREMLLQLLEFLGTQYTKDKEISWLLNNTNIHILPTMNPDGFNISSPGICDTNYGRTNNHVDLNRNFPEIFHPQSKVEQIETKAVRKWMEDYMFTLSASLHTGALVANYPFDSENKRYSWKDNIPSVTPDDDVFKYLATSYANKHATMHTGQHCGNNFPGGITNGAQWYPLSGGMQDYNYITGCMELTLEISCCKYPISSKLRKLWDENKNALINFPRLVHNGVKGILFHKENRKRIASAKLKISRRDFAFYTSKNGEFWRILLPGSYDLEVTYFNHTYSKIPFKVYPEKPTVMEIYITKESISFVSDEPITKSTTSSTTYKTIKTTTVQTKKPITTKPVILEPAQFTIRNRNHFAAASNRNNVCLLLLLICVLINV